MNYSETLQYLFNRLPIYSRVGSAAYKADLDNTLKMCELLGHPESKFKSIHVAGTNGKGSTSNILSSVLQEAGFKTGLYTSPHYHDFRERIRINGQPIPEQEVVDFISKWKSDLEGIDLSFFEMTVGMAYQYFAEQQVDFAIIEVGLGGRLDSTNVILPQVSVITNIGMDHVQFLGNSLREIAAEKAGIIKENVPVVIGETQAEVKSVFEQSSASNHTTLTFADAHWRIEESREKADENRLIDVFFEQAHFLNLSFPLKGNFQIKNLVTALETIRILKQSKVEISLPDIRTGIQNILLNTGIQGRWQVLNTKPLIICDSGHNRDGILSVIENLSLEEFENLHIVFGVVNDKQLSGILELLPKDASYYFCKADIPRGLAADQLLDTASGFGLEGNSFSSVADAFQAAKEKASEQDLIFVGGSIFVVAEVLDLN